MQSKPVLSHISPYVKTASVFLFALLGCAFYYISPACAAPAGTCTWDAPFHINQSIKIVTDIANQVSCMLFGTGATGGCISSDLKVLYPSMNVSRMLFVAITNHGAFTEVLQVAVTLYIVFFGIAFTVGLVNLTFMEFTTRLVKLGVIVMLVSPTSWDNYFAPTVVYFFKNGGDWLIGNIGAVVSFGAFTALSPFAIVDVAINNILSARMFVTLVAAFFSGPAGMILGLIILVSLGTFISAILQAIWIYLMSLVVKAFLLGLAPVFICFLLFSRTRHLFDGWLNQLISATLQPVFLFTFFGMFSRLALDAILYILSFDVCYMPTQGLFRGTPQDLVMPRFTRWGEPYGGVIGWNDFPLPIFDIIVFLILTQLTWRFNSIVIQIAKEISGATTSLNLQGAFSSAMSPGSMLTNRANKVASYTMKNLAPGRSTGGGNIQAAARNNVPGAGGGIRPGGVK